MHIYNSLLHSFSSNNFSYEQSNGASALPNSTQFESINPILQNTNVSTIIDQEAGSNNIIMQLEKDFKETIENEVQQHTEEMLSFIDAEIKQISGTGL